MPPATTPEPLAPIKWAKVIDNERCIGCHACTTACKSENEVPLSVTRTYVKYVDVGVFPHARRAFQVTRCNQCEWAPCTVACPTSAIVFGNINDKDSKVAKRKAEERDYQVLADLNFRPRTSYTAGVINPNPELA